MIPRFEKFVDLALALRDKPAAKNLHFSFIIRKNRVRAIGWNNSVKTHSLAYEHDYQYPMQHAELSAITRFDGKIEELRKCTLINVRINKEGQVLYSRPCKNCTRLLKAFSLNDVYFSDKRGIFIKF